jgi:hypothetical protein
MSLLRRRMIEDMTIHKLAPKTQQGCRRTTIAVTASIPYRGRNSTFRDSMSVPQLVFLPRAQIAGSAAIFSPRWTMKAS